MRCDGERVEVTQGIWPDNVTGTVGWEMNGIKCSNITKSHSSGSQLISIIVIHEWRRSISMRV
jgi:hypothetical protein